MPAMMRSKVVLPQPDGPSSATSSPVGMSRLISLRALNCPKRLLTLRMAMLMTVSLSMRGAARILGAYFDDGLGNQGHQRQQRQQRGDGESGDEVVFVIEHFNVQRHGIGEAADVARHHRYCSELAHRACVAEDHAVQQSPFDVGQGDVPEGLPAARAQRYRGLFLFFALLLH